MSLWRYFRRNQKQRDVREELDLHIQLETETYRRPILIAAGAVTDPDGLETFLRLCNPRNLGRRQNRSLSVLRDAPPQNRPQA